MHIATASSRQQEKWLGIPDAASLLVDRTSQSHSRSRFRCMTEQSTTLENTPSVLTLAVMPRTTQPH
jgi:hypothetical protein